MSATTTVITGITGEDDYVPRLVKMQTTATSLAQITSSSFLQGLNFQGITLLPTDEIHISYGNAQFAVVQLSGNQLSIWNPPGTVGVILPVVSGNYPVFANTTGQMQDSGTSPSSFLSITGGTLTGNLFLPGAATAPNQAVIYSQLSGMMSIPNNDLLANISGITAPATATTLTALIDSAIGNTQGDIIYRNASNWVALSPGMSGEFLQTLGSGNNVQWASPAGSGIVNASTANNLTYYAATGTTVSGLTTSDNGILVTNGSGVPSIGNILPAAVQLNISEVGTIVAGSWNGNLIGSSYGGTGINNGISTITIGGNFLLSGAYSFTGVLTNTTNVTFPTTGTLATTSQLPTPAALTEINDTNVTLTLGGSPSTALLQATSITVGWTGQLSLSRGGTNSSLIASNGGIVYSNASSLQILSGTVSANQVIISGSSSAPSWSSLSSLFDNVFGSAQGYILYRSAVDWQILSPGTSGQFLTTGGASANIYWSTFSLPSISNNNFLANISGISSPPSGTTLSAFLDSAIDNNQGDILYRNASIWTFLPAGTNGYFLQTGGSGANPSWQPGGSGTVSSSVANNLAYYSTNGTTVSGLSSANNGILITSGSGVPSISSTLPAAVQSNITSLGTITSGIWNGGIIGLAYGGTNTNLTASPGGVVWSNASSLQILAGTPTANQVLVSGSSVSPQWSTLSSLLDTVFNNSQGDILYRGASSWTFLAPGTSGYFLQTQGASANVQWAAGGSGTVSSGTANYLAYYSSTGTTVSGLATANNGVLVTSGAGVPSISSNLPVAVQTNITELGTITTGVWNGSIVTGTYGGTGVNNGSNLITIGNNVTFSGNSTFTATLTGTTAVTFPTSGTLATTSQLPTLPISLANGGTGASLTASNGGIFYSNASTGAILSGTATANQVLLSGTNAAPSWSTATYPATTTINQVLYSSAANVISGLATTTFGVLTTNSSGVPSITQNISLPATNSAGVGTIFLNSAAVLNAIGTNNIFLGFAGNFSLTTGSAIHNVGVGHLALGGLTTGASNSSIGYNAGQIISTGSLNSILGNLSLSALTTGSNNISIGSSSGINYTSSESSNITIGNNGTVTESNVIRLGTTGSGAGQQNKCFIAGIDGVSVGSTAQVVTEVSGQLGSAVITAGSNITITPTANVITIAATSSSIAWTNVSGTSQSMVTNNYYAANNAGLCTLSLPTTSNFGDSIKVLALGAGGFKITQASGQQIICGRVSSTLGSSGNVTSINQYDAISLVCMVANDTWVAVDGPVGNLNFN